jgi:hypothetical protein
MSEVGKLLVGWMEGPRTPGRDLGGPRQEPLLRVNHFSGRGLAEGRVWHRWARVKRHPRLVSLLIEHVLLLTFCYVEGALA